MSSSFECFLRIRATIYGCGVRGIYMHLISFKGSVLMIGVVLSPTGVYFLVCSVTYMIFAGHETNTLQ